MAPVSSSAEIGANTQLGLFCVICENVSIGAGCRIGHHVVIHADTIIGDGVRIDDNAVIGKKPMRSATSVMTQEKELEGARIGWLCRFLVHGIGGAAHNPGCSICIFPSGRARKVRMDSVYVFGRLCRICMVW